MTEPSVGMRATGDAIKGHVTQDGDLCLSTSACLQNLHALQVEGLGKHLNCLQEPWADQSLSGSSRRKLSIKVTILCPEHGFEMPPSPLSKLGGHHGVSSCHSAVMEAKPPPAGSATLFWEWG